MFFWFAVAVFVLGVLFGVASLFVPMESPSRTPIRMPITAQLDLLKVKDSRDPKHHDLNRRPRAD